MTQRRAGSFTACLAVLITILGVGEAFAQAGSLQFGAANYSVSEAGPSVTITVTRSGGSTGTVGIAYGTTAGTATGGATCSTGVDYITTTGQLSFAAGETSKTFTVPICDDAVYEGNESFVVTFPSPPTGGATLGTTTFATVTIVENDPVPQPGALQFGAANYSVSEAGPTVTITVTRTGGSDGTVGIAYGTATGGSATAGTTCSAGIDYITTTGQLTFAPGETSKTFTVPICDDTVYESNENFAVNFPSPPTGGATLGTPNFTEVTIVDDDPQPQPGVLQFGSATYSVSEAGPSVTITVTRTGGSNVPVGIAYGTTNGTATGGATCSTGIDYITTTGQLSFAVGETSKTFTVPICDDAVYEGNESFVVTFPSPPTGGATLGTTTFATVTIVENDPVPQPGVLQFGAANYSISEAGPSVTITVTRTGGSDGTVGTTFSTSNGSATGGIACGAGIDYITTSGPVTFAPGETSKNLTVPICEDALYEPNESFVAIFTSAPTGGATLGATNVATVTIVDNDDPPLSPSCFHFAPAASVVAGSHPSSVAAGDFNSDGKIDLAVANQSSNSVSIFLGAGDGTFVTALSYVTGSTPTSAAIGDFDGDGKADLAIANNVSNNVSILLGNGSGGFSAQPDAGAGTAPVFVLVGDFNGDGKTDLAVVNRDSNDVSILLGNGNGTFAIAVPYAVGTTPSGAAIGDFNGDGKADLVVSNTASNAVSILIGDGSGAFAAAITSSGFHGPTAVAVADFNGDGKRDLAVANGTTNEVAIAMGDGNGMFDPPITYATGTNPFSVAVGDFDGDGKLDLAVANQNSSNVSILLGTGNGVFAAAINSSTFSGPTSVAVADFNGDGKPDVAAANLIVSVLLNASTCVANCASLAAAATHPVLAAPYSVAVADFNGDGIPDLAVTGNTSNDVSILLGPGLAVGIHPTTGDGPSFLAVADFNGDGIPDLVVTNQVSNSTSILLGTGTTFTAAPDLRNSATPYSVAAADLNGDGKIDLVIAYPGTNNVSVWLGVGDGTFGPENTYPAGRGAFFVAVADFNGDGKPDLAVANQSANSVSILLGVGDGTFGTASDSRAGLTPHSIAVGDFNRDGKLDLAVANHGATTVSILLGDGNGGFTSGGTAGVGDAPESVAVADFNRDGKLDIATANPGSNNVSILIGNGSGGFATAVNYNVGTAPHAVAVADFNADGKPDVALANSNSNDVTILLNTCRFAELTLAMTHTDPFAQGQTNASFTITSSNVGIGATSGEVTVTDTLPVFLAATGMSGVGWACNLGTLTCTRSDALAGGASYPAITLTFTVASNAPNSVTNNAALSGGGDVNPANNLARDSAFVNQSVMIAPTSITATMASLSQINVTWDGVTGAASYQVYRSFNASAFVLVGTPTTTSFNNTLLAANTTYIYQIAAVNSSNVAGPMSMRDLATTIVFNEDPVVAGSTVIRASHFTELRTGISAVVFSAGQGIAMYAAAIAPGVSITAAHVEELRAKLISARNAIGNLRPLQFTDPSLTTTVTPIKAIHIQELRAAVK